MATPADLSSAAEAYSTQAALAAAAVQAVKPVRPQTPEKIATVIAAYQFLAAQQGVASVPLMLAEQGIAASPVAQVAAASLMGVASSGVPLVDVLPNVEPANMARFVATMIQDAGRTGSALQMAVTPTVTGYVRMLNPPSCDKCIVLAGRVYPTVGGIRFHKAGSAWARERQYDMPFQRHPLCDCRMIPVSEDTAYDLTTNPNAYFESLSREEQDATFGKANAEAIRLGADISQVVNARRGVQSAQLFGRKAKVTLSGTTSRGTFGRSNDRRTEKGKPRLPYRLMPETILAIADDYEDAIRLLTLYRYILPN